MKEQTMSDRGDLNTTEWDYTAHARYYECRPNYAGEAIDRMLEHAQARGGSVDLFAMGSSFNTTDRERTLAEAARVLRPGAWFACMWNNRDVQADPFQARVEAILREFFPDYSPGTRREDQTSVLQACPHFERLIQFDTPQAVEQPLDRYMAAWRSVRNRYWDLNTPEGEELFGRVEARMREELPEVMHMTYVTRMWMVRRVA